MIDENKVKLFLEKDFPNLDLMRLELNCLNNEEKQYIWDIKFRKKYRLFKKVFEKAFKMKLK